MSSQPRASVGSFVKDVRTLLLAVLAAMTIAGANAAALRTVLFALVLASPELVQRRDLRPEAAAFALWFALWASISWSINEELSARIAEDQLVVVLMFAAYRAAISDRRALVLVGLGYLLGCALLMQRLLAANPGATLDLRVDPTVRYSIDGVNQNYIAFSMVGGIAMAVLLWRSAPRWLPFWLLAGVVCWRGVQLTDTRAATLATTMLLIWLVIPARLYRPGLRVLTGLVLLLATAIVFGFADERLRASLAGSSERDIGDLNGRLDFWPIARDVFNDHPILGVGAGGITHYLPHGVYSHNVILDIGTSAGIIGVAVFLSAMWVTLFRATRDLSDRQRRAMLIGVAICAIAAPLLSGYWYQTAPFWLLLAVFSRLGALEPRRDGDEALSAVATLARVEPVAGRTTTAASGTVASVPARAGRSRR